MGYTGYVASSPPQVLGEKAPEVRVCWPGGARSARAAKDGARKRASCGLLRPPCWLSATPLQ
eukprot:2091863-Pyramimonas_sp.AAC.1